MLREEAQTQAKGDVHTQDGCSVALSSYNGLDCYTKMQKGDEDRSVKRKTPYIQSCDRWKGGGAAKQEEAHRVQTIEPGHQEEKN